MYLEVMSNAGSVGRAQAVDTGGRVLSFADKFELAYFWRGRWGCLSCPTTILRVHDRVPEDVIILHRVR